MNKWEALFCGMVEPTPDIQEGMFVIAKLGYKETGDSYDWVPTCEAYKRYLAWPKRCYTLTRFKFGLAFHLYLPMGEKCVRRMPKPTRSCGGWACCTGPGGLRTDDSVY